MDVLASAPESLMSLYIEAESMLRIRNQREVRVTVAKPEEGVPDVDRAFHLDLHVTKGRSYCFCVIATRIRSRQQRSRKTTKDMTIHDGVGEFDTFALCDLDSPSSLFKGLFFLQVTSKDS